MNAHGAALVLASLLCGTPTAQDQELQRQEQGMPIWDVEWRVDETGELLWRNAVPDAGGLRDWMPVDLVDGLANAGMVGWINVLLAGPRDLVSLADAERYFSMRGLGTRPGELRQLLVTPVTETEPTFARRQALERILAVRLIEERGIEQATGELRAATSDEEADPFLRLAVEDALGEREPAKVLVPDETLAALPPDADLLFFIDHTRLPPLFSLPRHGAELGRQILSRGEDEIPAGMLVRMQMLVELPPVLPFELALRYGNARVDWILGAAADLGPRGSLSLEVGGHFEPDVLAGSPASAALDAEGGVLRGERIGPLDLNLEVSEERVHLATWDFEQEPRESVADLREAGLGRAPIWIHAPKGSQFLQLPIATADATAEVEIGEQVTVVLRSRHESAELARQMASWLAALRELAEATLTAMDSGPELDKMLGVLRSVEPRAEDDACLVRVELGDLTVADVADFLSRFERW